MPPDAPPPLMPPWHAQSLADSASRLDVDLAGGLSEREASARQVRFGPNAIREASRRSKLRILLAQFGDFMILLLLGAALISGVIGDARDTAVIVAIVLLNAAVGFVQEFRAERAMEALKQMAAAGAVVVRDGYPRTVAADTLVPGDVVVLDAGNAVPADLRLVEAVDLKTGEAALTGESLPVEKHTAAIADHDLPLGDRRNMAFKGTLVLYGRGRGVVVATGMATELGHIASMLRTTEAPATPLQQRLARFGRQISLAALGICALVFAAGLLRGEPPVTMLLTALSLAVAAIPEAMPAVVTVLLALGAARMARVQALIRRLPAVETLGSVTVICSDKTGTLTRNEMHVVEAWLGAERRAASLLDASREPDASLLRALALCNDVTQDASGRTLGDPTEVALWRIAAERGFARSEYEQRMPRVQEVPFDSDRKRMTTIHADAGRFLSITKGAPEAVLSGCTAAMTPGGVVPIDRGQALGAADAMAANGLRVLAVASRSWNALPHDRTADTVERDLTFIGLVGMLDPLRDEAKAAVATCRDAGIKPIMITGDHPVTAHAIARQLGLLADGGETLTGRELQRLTDDELRRRVDRLRVYARVDPAQKIRIVAALQKAGDVVAMTGDGVNDAPALTRADIGVAMGKTGTDVARESASLILLDDNFATIVTAVREGRRIYDNIRKFIRFIVACNLAEILTIFLAPFLGLPMPLLPIQILWMNLVTDGLPGLALAAEPAEADVMRRPPRPPREGLFAAGMAWQVIWAGALMAAITLLAQAIGVRWCADHWQTMTFTVLTLTQMWQVLAVRSDHRLLFQQGLFSNLPLLGAVLLTFVLQLAIIYVPVLNPILHTEPLTAVELGACLALASLTFVALEVTKLIRRQ